MRQFFRSILTALSIACLAASFGAFSVDALAQAGGPPQLKQIALTQQQIDNVLAAAKEMEAITQTLPPNAPPNAQAVARLTDARETRRTPSLRDSGNSRCRSAANPALASCTGRRKVT